MKINILIFLVASLFCFNSARAEETIEPYSGLTNDYFSEINLNKFADKIIELANLKTESEIWPANKIYPNPGAILPFNRIVAYFGNFYSKGMGVLGEYSEATVIKKIKSEKLVWEKVDPKTPVILAVDYIATVAQGGAGRDGKYRKRMPEAEIKKALALAEKIEGITILEVQPGLSDLMEEVKYLEPYLKLAKVHLAIDPEFTMKNGRKPGKSVGSVNEEEVNKIIDYLDKLTKENNLPPKLLVIHRYTTAMVVGASKIKPTADVQVIMTMDGWGYPAGKLKTYNKVITQEPVQYSGFKLFYKNDKNLAGSRLMKPEEILKLQPIPSFIQYQ